ncbi:MAG: hypothetical protein IPL87_02800 [Candidatus Moraniibacteriota bacterium]|nr:MAG: hypothetical protein IPL87_02800 [Candidatus Moranbacteria bacterium]
MKIFAKLLAVVIPLFFFGKSALAEVFCKKVRKGDMVTITIQGTGGVFNSKLGEKPLAGMKTFQGTGRPDRDIAASCSDNSEACRRAEWIVIPVNKIRGTGDGEATHQITKNTYGATPCQYSTKDYGVTCRVRITQELFSSLKGGQGRLWFGVRFPGTGITVAAYQPQVGNCEVRNDEEGNPHTIMTVN